MKFYWQSDPPKGTLVLQEDLRMLKDKLKRKQAIVDRQEEELNARDKHMKDADTAAKEKESKANLDMQDKLSTCKVS